MNTERETRGIYDRITKTAHNHPTICGGYSFLRSPASRLLPSVNQHATQGKRCQKLRVINSLTSFFHAKVCVFAVRTTNTHTALSETKARVRDRGSGRKEPAPGPGSGAYQRSHPESPSNASITNHAKIEDFPLRPQIGLGRHAHRPKNLVKWVPGHADNPPTVWPGASAAS